MSVPLLMSRLSGKTAYPNQSAAKMLTRASWESFRDPVLNELIDAALKSNNDYQAAKESAAGLLQCKADRDKYKPDRQRISFKRQDLDVL